MTTTVSLTEKQVREMFAARERQDIERVIAGDPVAVAENMRIVARLRRQEAAMGPRSEPLHPIFRDHNCWKCDDGARPCAVGNPRQCEYPHARND